MYAVVVKVAIGDLEAAEGALREQVVSRVSQAPGFVTGYWMRKGDTGLSIVVFESEEDAKRAGEEVRSMALAGVTIEDVEVREVVAHA